MNDDFLEITRHKISFRNRGIEEATIQFKPEPTFKTKGVHSVISTETLKSSNQAKEYGNADCVPM